MEFPSVDHVVELNLFVLTVIRVKKADTSLVMNRSKIIEVIDACKGAEGDVYDKAVVLLKGLIQAHPFASGNRRTAFVATKDFLLHNHALFGIRDDPLHARVLLGIREGFYTHNEVKEWIKHGKIKEFRR